MHYRSHGEYALPKIEKVELLVCITDEEDPIKAENSGQYRTIKTIPAMARLDERGDIQFLATDGKGVEFKAGYRGCVFIFYKVYLREGNSYPSFVDTARPHYVDGETPFSVFPITQT